MPYNTIGSMYKSNRRKNSNNFDFLRFIAALIVFFSHSKALFGLQQPQLLVPPKRLYEITFGTFAVNIFFIISGFLILASWENRRSTFNYFKSRILRIFPALIINLFFCIFIMGPLMTSIQDKGLYFSVIFNKIDFFTKLNFETSFAFLRLPGVFFENPNYFMNGSLWTLPIEFGMYIFIFLTGFIWKKKVLPTLMTIAYFIYFNDKISTPRMMSHLPFIFCGCFFIGAWIYRYRDIIPYNRYLFWSCVNILIYFHLDNIYLLPLHILCTSYAVIYLAFADLKFINVKKFGTLGDVSYGIYIYAWPMQQVVISIFTIEGSFYFYVIASLLSTLILAILSWFLIEKPALKLKSRSRRKLISASPHIST